MFWDVIIFHVLQVGVFLLYNLLCLVQTVYLAGLYQWWLFPMHSQEVQLSALDYRTAESTGDPRLIDFRVTVCVCCNPFVVFHSL